MREIDDAHDAERETETDRQEPVNSANQNPAQHGLQNGEHLGLDARHFFAAEPPLRYRRRRLPRGVGAVKTILRVTPHLPRDVNHQGQLRALLVGIDVVAEER